ncbi:double-strand break repair protein [Malassezia pachydermatis]
MALTRVWADVRFVIAENVLPERADTLAQQLKEAGAVHVAWSTLRRASDEETRVSFQDTVTHFITDSIHAPYVAWCTQPTDEDMHVDGPVAVTPAWATRSLALNIPQPPHLYSPDPQKIFSGIVICCAHLSPMDTEMLSSAVVSLGGGFKQTLCEDVTHLVAISRENSKVQALQNHPDVSIQVVAPHWINDSFSVNRLLPLTDYVFDMSQPDSLPICLRATWDVPPSASIEPDPSPLERTAQASVLASKVVLLARDVHGGALESHPQLHSLRDRIGRAGGECAPTLEETVSDEDVRSAVQKADIVVARYRESPEARWAYSQGKTVGTLVWLVKALSSGHMTSPRDRLLHFPYPHTPIPGFSSMTITLTNYTGQARTYLKELIMKMGATFTPEMRPTTNVCVALALQGEKVTKAREWNIPIVNHIWLETCFATWTNQNLAQRSFITFPGAAKLAAVVGRVGIDETSLAPWKTPEAATDDRSPTPAADEVPPIALPETDAPTPTPPPSSPPEAQADKDETPLDEAMAPIDEDVGDTEAPPKRAASPPPSSPPAPKRTKPSTPIYATTSVDVSDADVAALEALHVRRTDNMAEATHLVAKSLTRTEKMLCAIARGLHIVSVAWLQAMIKQNQVLEADAFALRDKAKEKQWAIKLSEVLAKSRAHPASLLQGHQFFITKQVQPSREILSHIIEAAGGHVVAATAKTRGTLLTPSTSHVIGCEDDAKVLQALETSYRKAGHEGDAPWRVYTPELILAGVLRQDMDWSDTNALTLSS